MQTYRMLITTENLVNGQMRQITERVRHIPEAELDARRATSRLSAPAGATRTIRVLAED